MNLSHIKLIQNKIDLYQWDVNCGICLDTLNRCLYVNIKESIDSVIFHLGNQTHTFKMQQLNGFHIRLKIERTFFTMILVRILFFIHNWLTSVF